jgi:hypothetical protein
MMTKRSIPTDPVVHEQPWQIEKPGKPGDDENDVKCLEPEHGLLAYRARAVAGMHAPGGGD